MGALILKNVSDEHRSWEFTEQKGFDPTDSSGVDMIFSIKKSQVFLAEPFTATAPWVSDRGRLFFENFFKNNKTILNSNQSFEWLKIFNQVIENFYFISLLNFKTFNNIICLIFDNVCSKELSFLFALESLFSFINLKKLNKKESSADLETNYQLSKLSTEPFIEFSNVLVLLGLDLRYESFYLNLQLKNRLSKGRFNIFSFGPKSNSVIPQKNLGSSFFKKLNWINGTSNDCQLFFLTRNLLMIGSNHLYEKKNFQNFMENLLSLKIPVFQNLFSAIPQDLNAASESSIKNVVSLNSSSFFKSSCLIFINSDLFKNNCSKNLIEFYFIKQNQTLNKTIVFQNHTNKGLKFFENCKLKKIKNNHFFYFYLPNKLIFEEKKEFLNNLGASKKIAKTVNFTENSKSNLQILNKLKNLFNNGKSVLTNKKDMHLMFQGFTDEKKLTLFNRYLCLGSNLLTTMDFFYNSNNKPFILPKYIFVNSSNYFKVYNFKIKYWLDDFYTLNFQEKFGPVSSTLIKCSKIFRKEFLNFF